MTYIDEEKKPDVASGKNVAVAIFLHILLFAALWFFGQFEFTKKELVIPVELTVVVDTPPPPPKVEEKKPVEEKPKPPKPPPKKEDPPKPKEAVEQIQVKTNKIVKVEKPKEEKPKEEKKPEPPKKTAAEIRKERLDAMRKSAKDVTIKESKPSKEKPPPNWQELLNKGYKPGETTQIAPNEESRCLGILKQSIDDKWRELSPQTGAPGHVYITIRFSRGGVIAAHSLSKSSGDRLSDAAAMKVVGSIGSVRGLSAEFLDKYSKEPITIRYKIESLH